MVDIDMGSILKKAQTYMNSSEGKKKVDNVMNQAMLGSIQLELGGTIHTPEETASKFIEVLRNSINSSGLSSGAIAAISNIEHSSAHSIGNNSYTIDVYFTGDMSRPSLDPEKYGGISDLAELFNNGVDHKMKPIRGTWHGNEIWSKTTIPGTYFMEQAVSDFMGNYASEYNVISVQLNKSF